MVFIITTLILFALLIAIAIFGYFTRPVIDKRIQEAIEQKIGQENLGIIKIEIPTDFVGCPFKSTVSQFSANVIARSLGLDSSYSTYRKLYVFNLKTEVREIWWIKMVFDVTILDTVTLKPGLEK